MSTNEQQQKAPQETRNVVNFLRSSKAGLKNRVGVLNGKRVDYFKGMMRLSPSIPPPMRFCNAVLWPLGRSAVKALLSPAYAKTKNTPKITSEEEAHNLLHNIIPFTFFLRVDRGQPVGSASSPKSLQINQMQLFKPDEYYAWFYEGSQWTNYVGGVAMVAIILAGVMFPLWPPILRLGVWYLSLVFLGLIGLLLVISVIRLIFYVITVLVASPGIWIFPRLFADVGFVDSFIPLWEWDLPKKKSKNKKKSAEKSDKGKGASSGVNTPDHAVDDVDDSGVSAANSRSVSRAATVEEVPEEIS
ncbi:translocation protein [Russula emetica]|nr:translocation protein [Russula emetica]